MQSRNWKKDIVKLILIQKAYLSIDKEKNIIELGKDKPKLEDIDVRYISLIKFSKKV